MVSTLKKRFKRGRALSPIMSTVILVAVAITVAVAVAYWMGDISSKYTKREEIRISHFTYGLKSSDQKNIIVLKVKNTGPVNLNISEVYVNDTIRTFNITGGKALLDVDEDRIIIINRVGWISGGKYQIKILTARENGFIKKSIAP